MSYKDFLDTLALWDGKSSFGLDNIRTLMAKLANCQDSNPSVLIGGTNGKGSVGVMLSSILSKQYKNVGYSISPHLIRLNERIIINGQEISDSKLEELCIELERTLNVLDIKPSFFEVMTAASFLAFSNLDFAVYEVGLGGRLDATNILKKPELSIISSISYDHVKFLGNTLEEICREKVEIMRENSCMAVGELNSSCLEIVDNKAKQLNSKVLALGRDFFVEKKDSQGTYTYRDLKEINLEFRPSLRGEHQAQNAAIAIAAGLELNISKENCRKGVEGAFWPGRLEKIRFSYRDLILDCAHNPDGTEKLISFLDSEGIEELDIIYASLNTKDWKASLGKLKKYIVNWNIVECDSASTVSCDEISNMLKSLNISKISNYYRDLEGLLRRIQESKDSRPILVCGSMYMLGELRGILRELFKLDIDYPYW